jgi:acetyl-CoA carboxylase beta subunit
MLTGSRKPARKPAKDAMLVAEGRWVRALFVVQDFPYGGSIMSCMSAAIIATAERTGVKRPLILFSTAVARVYTEGLMQVPHATIAVQMLKEAQGFRIL